MPHGTTLCYLPPGRGDIPALTPAEAGTRLSDPAGMQGWADLEKVHDTVDRDQDELDEALVWLSVHCYPIVSCCIQVQNGLSFWYRLSQTVLVNMLSNECLFFQVFTTNSFYRSIEVRIICDCLNAFCRYVFLCNQVFTGLMQHKPVCGAAVNLVHQLLPSLLLLHRDIVPNVRISLARCLARHFVCFCMFTCVLTLFLSVLYSRKNVVI